MSNDNLGNVPLGPQPSRHPYARPANTPDMRDVLNSAESIAAYVKQHGLGSTNKVSPKPVRHSLGRGVPSDSLLALERSQNEDEED